VFTSIPGVLISDTLKIGIFQSRPYKKHSYEERCGERYEAGQFSNFYIHLVILKSTMKEKLFS